jgi:cytoskeletal protein RodZ
VRPPKKEYLGRPSSEIPWMRIAAAICVLMAVFFLWSRYTRSPRTARAMPISAPASQPPAASAAAPPPQTPQISPSPAPPTQIATPPPSASTEPEKPTAPVPQPVSNAPAPTPKADTSEDPNAVKVEKKGDVTIRSFGAATAKPAEKSATTIKLVIRASENSWISITADGQLLTQETLIAPAATSFHATRELVVRVGNAAGISFLWNGQELAPQGAEAEAKTFIFDAEGMHASPPPPQN